MRKILICAFALFGVALVWAGAPATVPAKTKAPTRSAAAKPTAAARRGTSAVRTTWRNRQTSPTPGRFREIQNALAERGYLSSEQATGIWGPSSAEALKRFQSEQTLESTGKIDSLSLIALGLGPKHDSPPSRMADNNVQAENARN
jgi:peptidoglycan hydrolase-like protein with peptidoglycan-binding domain